MFGSIASIILIHELHIDHYVVKNISAGALAYLHMGTILSFIFFAAATGFLGFRESEEPPRGRDRIKESPRVLKCVWALVTCQEATHWRQCGSDGKTKANFETHCIGFAGTSGKLIGEQQLSHVASLTRNSAEQLRSQEGYCMPFSADLSVTGI